MHYHNPAHTLYVLEKVVEIGEKENIPEKELFLIKVAALYHDSGFTKSRKDH